MKKKIFVSIMAVVLAFSAVGCGKGKKDSTPEDPNAAVRDEIVTFVKLFASSLYASSSK